MAEENIHNVDVRLRYISTMGSRTAAEDRLSEAFAPGSVIRSNIQSAGFGRLVSADINPDECEGYRNYETSSIALWLKNDRKLYDQCRAVALTVISDEEVTSRAEKEDERSPELVMADWLQQFVETKLQVDRRESRASTDEERMFVSLAQAALGDVNWFELAEEWISDVREG